MSKTPTFEFTAFAVIKCLSYMLCVMPYANGTFS